MSQKGEEQSSMEIGAFTSSAETASQEDVAGVTYMVCLTIFGVNMCVLVLCILHEVRIKRVELHCKWRLVVPSVTWCQKCFVNLMASCNAQDYVFWFIFSQSSY